MSCDAQELEFVIPGLCEAQGPLTASSLPPFNQEVLSTHPVIGLFIHWGIGSQEVT